MASGDSCTIHPSVKQPLESIDITKALRDPVKLQFLVCGRTGVGKSSLINSLLGRQVCNVNDPGMNLENATAAFSAGTTKVNKTVFKVDEMLVSVWDSPGLQDGTEHEDSYLQSMYDNCKDVDLVLYCMEMTTVRWTPNEKRALELLTRKFGPEFWKKTVLVLTKANMVSVPPKEKGKERDYHQRLYCNFTKIFHDQLAAQGVPESIAKKVPCVAAGLCDPEDDSEEGRFVWYVSGKSKSCGDRVQVDFLYELWVTCFETISRRNRDYFVIATTRQRVKPLNGPTQEEQERLMKILEETAAREKAEKEKRERLEREIQEQSRRHQEDMQRMQQQIHQLSTSTVSQTSSSSSGSSSSAGGQVFGAAAGATAGGLMFGPAGAVIGGVFGALFGK